MKAIPYIRVSPLTATLNQEKILLNYIEAQGWEALPTIINNGNGQSLASESLTHLRELVREGKCDVVVILRPDRLVRNESLFEGLVQEFARHNVRIAIP